MATQLRTSTETTIATQALLICATIIAGAVAALMALTVNEPKIALGLMIGLFCGTVIILHPPVGVVFIIIMMPVVEIFPPTYFGSGMFNPTNLVLAWVAFSILLHRIFVLKIGIAKRAFLPPVMGYAAVLIYSIALAMMHEGSLAEFAGLTRTYLNGAFLYFLAANVIDDLKPTRWIFWAIVVTVSLTALWGLVEYRNDLAGGMAPDRIRISGRVGQPNSFGAYLAMYLPFVIAASRLSGISRLLKICAVGSAVACVFALIFTQSRGAYLGVLTALLFFGFITNRKLVLVMLAAACTYPFWLPQQAIDRVTMTFEDRGEGQYDRSTNARLEFYRAGLEMWWDSPLWGHGFGQFNRLIKARGYRDEERAAHSLLIQMISETGIIGLGTLLFMLAYLFRRAWRLYRSTQNEFLRRFGEAYCGCIIALVLVNAFGVRFYNFLEIGYFWMLSALLVRFTEPMVRRDVEKQRALEGEL